jgi:A/G-specific adenine glycosylase
MLQQTQVKTVIPFWERWTRELPTIEAAAKAPSGKIHKLWEGLGYYTRVRNLQKAAQVIVENHGGKFPENFEDILALPGIGRYTAGAICSIAFNQPRPILDGNVIRVLTRIFGIAKNPKARQVNTRLWQLAEELVSHAKTQGAHRKNSSGLAVSAALRENNSCSFFNQSLMELGALICSPRNPQCGICPVKKLCVAFKESRVEELPNLGKREAATARRFVAFVVERNGRFLVRQRRAGAVNAHLWEFPNVEVNGTELDAPEIFKSEFGQVPEKIMPLATVKHSITRYHITLEAFSASSSRTSRASGVWKTPAQMERLAFTAAHKKLASAAAKSILSGR